MKTGMVLEGGAMRGIYTAGVLDVFWEEEIRPEGVIGVSAGAIHGSCFISGQPGRSIRYYKKYSRDKRFFSLYSLMTTGSMVGEQFCYHDIPDRLDPFDFEAFARSPMAFYVACTDLATGRAVYHHCIDLKNEMDWMRASASMPLVSKIVEINGGKYLDGGIADSIPIRAFRALGYERNIVVLTRPAGYQKKPQNPALVKRLYRSYPALVEMMQNRHLVYNHTLVLLEELERRGEIFLLRPSEDLHIGRTEKNPACLTAQYELGQKDARARIKDLKRWLSEKKESK